MKMHFAALLPAFALSACFSPDVAALEKKMLRDCNTVPFAGHCGEEGANANELFKQYGQRCVVDAEIQDCILSLDSCEEFSLGGDGDACWPASAEGTICNIDYNDECHRRCLDASDGCGTDSETRCSPDVLGDCLDAFETCMAACKL